MNPKLIWANFVSSNLEKTNDFYSKLGFKPNGTYKAGQEAVSFFFGTTNFVINFFSQQRLEKEVNGNLSLPKAGHEIMFSLSAESKAVVDNWVEKVKLAGGKVFSDPQPYDKGYTMGFEDPDGHRFNVLYWPGM